ncbi:acid-sensing ion channel 2-like [Mytilus californianus]|uniref:acid-sensing ion channel 2-like n=1 Tax=Mytilus californianus TaxID=6549 RepID=UPI0022480CD4|nr:acid-sensing ion channel 2-like [Mytilus californianus]
MLLIRIKDTLRNFAGNTTLHGIDRVSSRKHVIGKVLWACIVLTCVSSCFIQIYRLGVQYASKQVITKISIQNQKIYFPAVSICNLNPISFLKIQREYQRDQLNGSLTGLVGDLVYSKYLQIFTNINTQLEDSPELIRMGKRKRRDVQRTYEDSQAPPNVTIHRTDYKAKIGGTVTLQCEVTDITSSFVVQWQKWEYDSSTFMNISSDKANKYNGSTTITPSLTIFNVEYNDEGSYTCTAGNKHGTDKSPIIYLTVTYNVLDNIWRGSERFRLSVFGLTNFFSQKAETIIKDLSADFSDFVIYCNFEGRQCNKSMFVPFVDKYYGKCYRFPSKPIITQRAGPLFALQLLINVNQSDYVPYITSEAGIRLSIHEHGSQPFLENNGFSVATGFRTDVSLFKKRIERMSGTTVCDTSNKFSNIIACFEDCVERNIKEKCQCLQSMFTETTICANYATACILAVRRNVTGCNCNTPCSEKQHIKTIHTSRWPAKNYEGLLDKILKSKGLSLSNTSDSLLQVNIYFSSLYEEVTEEILSFTFENFLSNIGGALGLCIGMSAISIGELLELCFFLLRSMTRRKRAKENQPDVSLNEIAETTTISDQNKTQSVHIDMSIIHEEESGL